MLTHTYVVPVPYDLLPDRELNALCCKRLGWQWKPHLWEFGSNWQYHAWFKGETLMGLPNFLLEDPLSVQLQRFLEEQELEKRYAEILFELVQGSTLSPEKAWYRLAHATPRQRIEAFLKVTEAE
ncbi:hypothetical protein [Deinococcus cellulosilyticus]|uniref:Uncharacterized protein n=1 Tax=Deinococcus cellulosilyticus (strain DSM 18568 / NBRC 106333 / KACC 11606 / 5516J-15) TaxID=1223518 RepID=A0A511N0E9_DEIC1|nr:hypothetical protein [Deinococcus cellulosilyticus]GEM46360.1 hypothetical protein DC3_19950 [Deinococcus cellulosilyticus NBRC 106333 = KACC 11606]